MSDFLLCDKNNSYYLKPLLIVFYSIFITWQHKPFLINMNYVTNDRNRENWQGGYIWKEEMINLFWYDQFELICSMSPLTVGGSIV